LEKRNIFNEIKLLMNMEKNAVELDKLDFAILSFLQKDGRMSFTVMAKKLKVSIGTIRTRFNNLVKEGTVSIVGRVIPEKVGFHSYAHIDIHIRPATLKETVARKIARLPEISFLALTSGDYDLEVDVMCRDHDHLVQFVEKISKLHGVDQIKTTIYLKVYKYAQPDLTLLS